MTTLRNQTFLILDCQTTGMRPSVGQLLEFAWGFASSETKSFDIQSSLLELGAGESIPPRVKEITGLKMSDLDFARPLDSVRADFVKSLADFTAVNGRPVALIHYAQFEEAWLKDLLQTTVLPFDLLCTHRISKKLFPQVPSRNVRGLTGFFGMRIGEIKRAAQHVLATQLIWRGLVEELTKAGHQTVEDVRAYLVEKPPKPVKKSAKGAGKNAVMQDPETEKNKKAPPKFSYEYRVDREKRLALPAKPGIYKMLASNGDILYVGKATSLRDRVNSYFRGKKGRDPRKLELMAQVWDFDIIECASAVEAALIESDEIKRLNPPYNVSLKEGNRALLYYDHALTTESLVPSADFPVGPFRRFNSIDHMRVFADGLKRDEIVNVFYQPIEAQVLEDGYALFEEKYESRFRPDRFSTRCHLAFALTLLRDHLKIEKLALSEVIDDAVDVPQIETETEPEYTPADVLEKIEHLYLRAAETYLRAKRLTHLLHSNVKWVEKGQEKSLSVRSGKIVNPVPSTDISATVTPGANGCLWSGLTISDYDRMSVLLSEISKVDHSIERVGPKNPWSPNTQSL